MDNTSILVSIGIPTYNRAHGYLRNTLECALNQTYKNIEIIVADNGSTDSTEDVIKAYSDQRIRYHKHKTNIGANNNFNFCLRMARGKYFLLLHDDDLIDIDFVESCIQALEGNHEPGLIRTGTRKIDSSGNTILEQTNYIEGDTLEDFIMAWFQGKIGLFMCSTLFHTERLKEIDGFQSKTHLYQDVIAEVLLAEKYGWVDVYDIKASFRVHYDSRGKAKKIEAWNEDCRYLLDIICSLIPDKAGTIKEIGLNYFSRQNYGRAGRFRNRIERWMAYLKIYRAFDYVCSPLHYWVPRMVKSRIKSVKRRLKPNLYICIG